uniref:Ig-like domain-containing protein n=1 Tax=Amphiprion ocellaris TaxID=80972 RepID=A0AAQ5Z0Y7_AMPOC
VCSAYDFYSKQIRVSWLWNGQEVTSGVSFTEAMPSGDWFYQVHSFLEFTPTRGERIACRVEHLSLSEAMLVVWDTSHPVSERAKMVIGTFLLIFGFVLMSTRFIYYKKKLRENFTLCQGDVRQKLLHYFAL